MTAKRVFAYATGRALRRKLGFRDLAVHLTDAPPWVEPPGTAERFACAFIEFNEKNVRVAAGWLMSLTTIHPSIKVWVIAPTGLARKLGPLLSALTADVLPPSTSSTVLERRASSCISSRKKRARRSLLTPAEKREIASKIQGGMYESTFLIQDGVICYATVAMFDNLGYTQKMVVGHHFLEFIPPAQREGVAAIYEAHLSGGLDPAPYEIMFLDTGGEAVPAEIIVFGTTFRGRPAVAGTIRNVTDRHALRAMMGKREKELSLIGSVTHQLLAGRSLKTALRSALDLVIGALEADAGTLVLAATSRGPFTPMAARIRSRDSFSPWSACGSIDEIRLFPSILKRLRKGEAVLGAPCEMTSTLGKHHLTAPLLIQKRLRGFFFTLRLQGEPFSDEDARLLSSVAAEAAMGVENRRLYEDLRASYSDLLEAQRELLRAERLAVIGNMAAHVAHEIRNPVATIMNATGQIRRRIKLGDVESELADIVEEELERLRRLCDDLVTFSRAPRPRPRPVRLDGFLDFVRSDLVKGHCIPDGVAVDIRVTPPSLEVDHDPDILYPLLRNLVMNSIQSMGMKGRVELSASLARKKLDLSVSDSGQGIPAEIIDRIFDPFFSTHPESVGLGLAIVKNYVEELGGELSVDSTPGKGTTVRLLLPPSQGDPKGL